MRIGNDCDLDIKKYLLLASYLTILALSDWISGTDDQQEQHFTVDKIISHPRYNSPTKTNNDIALIKLHKPAILNKYVKTICLPESSDSPAPKTPCYITGRLN